MRFMAVGEYFPIEILAALINLYNMKDEMKKCRGNIYSNDGDVL